MTPQQHFNLCKALYKFGYNAKTDFVYTESGLRISKLEAPEEPIECHAPTNEQIVDWLTKYCTQNLDVGMFNGLHEIQFPLLGQLLINLKLYLAYNSVRYVINYRSATTFTVNWNYSENSTIYATIIITGTELQAMIHGTESGIEYLRSKLTYNGLSKT